MDFCKGSYEPIKIFRNGLAATFAQIDASLFFCSAASTDDQKCCGVRFFEDCCFLRTSTKNRFHENIL